jgi:hypothetical protein
MFKALEDDLLAGGVEVVLGAWRTLLTMALNVFRGDAGTFSARGTFCRYVRAAACFVEALHELAERLSSLTNADDRTLRDRLVKAIGLAVMIGRAYSHQGPEYSLSDMKARALMVVKVTSPCHLPH